MSNSYFTETLDEMCRLLIDTDARAILDWECNTKLCYFINTVAKSIVLSKSENGTLEIDRLGRVALPPEILRQLIWGAGDAINATPSTRSNTLKLSMGIKNTAKCILCERPEKIITINGKDICKHCATDVARARLN